MASQIDQKGTAIVFIDTVMIFNDDDFDFFVGERFSLTTSAKLSRGVPDLPNLRLQAAPTLPALSLFREVMGRSRE